MLAKRQPALDPADPVLDGEDSSDRLGCMALSGLGPWIDPKAEACDLAVPDSTLAGLRNGRALNHALGEFLLRHGDRNIRSFPSHRYHSATNSSETGRNAPQPDKQETLCKTTYKADFWNVLKSPEMLIPNIAKVGVGRSNRLARSMSGRK
nr:hypothetical protein [uncultured Brevundimonas sp.]